MLAILYNSLDTCLRVFPTEGMGGVAPTIRTFAHPPRPPPIKPPPPNFYPSLPPISPPKVNSSKNCSHCSCTIFILISYSLNTQIMLILILIYVKYTQKAVFSFEKGSNSQSHSSSGSHHLIKNLPSKISNSPCLLTTIWKTLCLDDYKAYKADLPM